MSGIAIEIATLDGGMVCQRYERLYESCPQALVQQSVAWARAIAPIGPDEVFFLVARQGGRDIAGLPLYFFDGPLGPIATSVPQPGPMGGVFTASDLDPPTLSECYRALLSRAEALARERKCLTLTFITNPFADDVDMYREYLRPDIELENFTQSVGVSDIVVDGHLATDRTDRRGNVERNLRKARAFGFETRLCESAAEFNAWYAAHVKRHTEIGATPLRLDLMQSLLRELVPAGKAFLELAAKDGQVAAGCLFVGHRDIWDAYMLSMDSDYVAHAPNYLVCASGLERLNRYGARIFNWQSSASRASGVYAFKKQWACIERSYSFVTRILAPRSVFATASRSALAAGYAGHFVLPFEALDAPEKKRFGKL